MAPRYNRREARRKANIFKTWDLEAEDRMRSEATEEAEEAERAAAALVERERAAFQHAVERLVKPVATVKVLAAKVAATPDNKRKCASVKVVAKKLHKVAVVMPQVEQEKADTQRAEEKVAATPIDKENNADAALKDPMMVAATRVDNNEINAAATLMDNLQPTTECLRHIFEQYLDDSESE